MEFTPDQVRAFRYWIQGYLHFYEPIVEEYFRVSGYRILRRPALVRRPDIQRVDHALFDKRSWSPRVEQRRRRCAS